MIVQISKLSSVVRVRLPVVGGKWGIALRVAPIVLAVAGAKLIVNALGWETLSSNPLLGSVIAATVFIFGFLLAGTLADYKESERLPGELAVSLEAIADECLILYEDKRPDAARECLAHVRRLAALLRSWFFERERTHDVLDSITGLNRYFLAFEAYTQPNFIVRLKQEQTAIRRVVTRIHMIRETSFVAAGYAIAELATAFLLLTLLVTDVGPLAEEIVVVSVIAFVLVYMTFLIKDLDDPFDYASGNGVADVSLHPLDHLDERVANALAGLDEDPVVASSS